MDEEEEMQGLEIASEEDLIEIGNAILENLGIKQRVAEPEDMISDQFYLIVFEEAFPQIDFSELKPGETEEEAGENLQMLIDMLGEQILNLDLKHIRGDEIVKGNMADLSQFLQLVLEVSLLVAEKREGGAEDDPDELEEDDPDALPGEEGAGFDPAEFEASDPRNRRDASDKKDPK